MTRPFVKMNGAGNDFVVVNALDRPFQPTTEQVRALGDRDTGEGFDQLIAIEPSETGDAFMRVWNSDGSAVETCGNALRCVGWMLMQASGADSVTIDTLGGPATGFGDITLPGAWGRILSIAVMLIGITLFVRLGQTLLKPHKVHFPCDACGLGAGSNHQHPL